MSVKEKTLFADILAESKDGEWGKGEAEFGLEQVLIIRGTDFKKLHNPNADFPLRWVKSDLVKRKRLVAGDLILETAGGTSNESTGRSALLKDTFFQHHSDVPILCASFSRFLRLKTNEYYPAYIYYLLQSLHKSGYMAVFNIQHTGVSRFQFTSFKNKTHLDIPEFSVQQKIAAILAAYDDLIENNNKRIALLEKAAEEIYREWFVRMRFPGWEQTKFVKGVPERWEVKKLGELVTTQYGYTTSAEDIVTGIKFLRITDIVPNVIDWDNVPFCSIDDGSKNKYLLCEGDIVVARTGATVGYAKRINKLHPTSIFASYLVRLKPKSTIQSIFLGMTVESSKYKEFINMFITGAAQPQANATVMSLFPLLLPTNDLLLQFNKIIEPIFDKKEQFILINSKLKQSRDLLLSRLISGKLSVEALDIRFPPSMIAQ